MAKRERYSPKIKYFPRCFSGANIIYSVNPINKIPLNINGNKHIQH
jgi:hypothetical protein